MRLPKLVIVISVVSALAVWSVSCSDEDDPIAPQTAALIVRDQTPPAADIVEIERVYAEAAGFISVVQGKDGQATASIIGVRAIAAGEQRDWAIAIERPLVDQELLYARLHLDSNANGELDWQPGGTLDPIVQVDGERLQSAFTITSTLPLVPSVLIDDQAVQSSSTGADLLTVKSTVTATSGFVILQDQVATSTRTVYGVAELELGLDVLVPVILTASVAPQAGLEAALYSDEDEDGAFDRTIDLPIEVDGSPVRALFTIEDEAP